jgi:hypothetical protein
MNGDEFEGKATGPLIDRLSQQAQILRLLVNRAGDSVDLLTWTVDIHLTGNRAGPKPECPPAEQ